MGARDATGRRPPQDWGVGSAPPSASASAPDARTRWQRSVRTAGRRSWTGGIFRLGRFAASLKMTRKGVAVAQGDTGKALRRQDAGATTAQGDRERGCYDLADS